MLDWKTFEDFDACSPLLAEAIALRSGILAAIDLEITSIRIFSDCQTLIRAIENKQPVKEIFGIVFDIRQISSVFVSISFFLTFRVLKTVKPTVWLNGLFISLVFRCKLRNWAFIGPFSFLCFINIICCSKKKCNYLSMWLKHILNLNRYTHHMLVNNTTDKLPHLERPLLSLMSSCVDSFTKYIDI